MQGYLGYFLFCRSVRGPLRMVVKVRSDAA